MKDKLRNTGCPEAISLAILGHSTNTVAANYGSGYALEVMREHMEKVCGERTLNQNAANGRKEPKTTDAARRNDVWLGDWSQNGFRTVVQSCR